MKDIDVQQGFCAMNVSDFLQSMQLGEWSFQRSSNPRLQYECHPGNGKFLPPDSPDRL